MLYLISIIFINWRRLEWSGEWALEKSHCTLAFKARWCDHTLFFRCTAENLVANATRWSSTLSPGYKNPQLVGNIVLLQVLVDVSRFSPCVINLSHNKNICCGLKKVVAKSRARVYFVQQILALLLVFHQTHNLACNKFARALANQPIRALHFFDLQQMFLLRIKLITHGEKRETLIKTCTETILRDKLGVFVSRILPP